MIISSRDNPRIKSVRELVTDARESRRRGEALIDGVHLVTACVHRSVPLKLLLVSESAQSNTEITALLAQSSDAECLILRDGLFKEISGMATPVGIAAVIDIPQSSDEKLIGDIVMLDAVQDAGNVGAIFRTAAAAGVCNVVLGAGCASAWGQKVLRAAQGAHFSLKIREQVDLVATLATIDGVSLAAVARDGNSLFKTDLTQPTVWLFGNEGGGLSSAVVAAATRRITIPLMADSESLNVAAAAAICLFEAKRQRSI